jgi:hypothetical protein
MNFFLFKRAIGVVFLVLVCSRYSYAAEQSLPASSVGDGVKYLNLLQKQLSNVIGYSFSSEITTWKNPDFFSKQSIQDELGKKGTVSFLVSGSKYRIENRRWINLDGYKFYTLTAYDGKTFQNFRYYTGQLTIKTAPIPINHICPRNTDAFLAPFAWFLDGPLENEATDPSLDRLKSIEQWNQFSGKLLSVSQVNLDGKECIRLDFYDKINPDPNPKANLSAETATKMETRYAVYLSKSDQYYPIGWDRLSMDGVLLSKYRVTDLRTISSNGIGFYCPVKTTRYLYGGGFGGGDALGDHSNSPKMTVTTELSSVKINPLPDDSEFTIDPSQARKILDIDHHTWINVPN